MQNKRILISAIAVIVSVVALGGYFSARAMRNAATQIKASGTVEAVVVDISPELSSKIKNVLVEEGQTVKAGDPIFILDGTLLEQQHKVALANLDSAKAAGQTSKIALDIAQAQYQVALQAALAQDKNTRLADWRSPDQQQFDQPNWYFTRAEQAQAAQILVDQAKKALDDAKGKLTDVTNDLDKANFLAAEQRLLNARLEYLITRDVNSHAQNANVNSQPVTLSDLRNCAKNQGYDLARTDLMNLVLGCAPDQHLAKASQALYDTSKDELTQAQQAYDDLLTTSAANEVLQARADLSVAQERYYATLDHLRAFQTGDQSPSVTTAQEVVDQAQAAYDQSLKAVAQTQANLDLLDAQIAKLTVSAPEDGVILTRSVEPGEFVQAGASALTIANLSQLTITVYVPEDRYGQISLGQKATLSVDSFPGTLFNAEVKQISNQAEFTPRNVQTVEGRSSTVYAIKLTVSDPQGKLKPGMPADVTFR